MGNFLTGLFQGAGTLVGGPGNAGAASSNAWNYGQYSPFTVNNPAGQISFNGTTANAGLSGPAAGLQSGLYGAANAGLGAAGGYNPNTSFLPQQYQNIFGNFQGNVADQFQHLQQSQAPWVAQGNASDRDNQFAKGTLASTAGGYQTAGHDMANNALMQQNYGQAFQNANQLANSQFGAAQGTAQLGEQQAQFAPQQGLGLLNSSMTGINNQNSFLNQLLMSGGNLGAQRSGANVAAATPGIETGNIQDNATAGFLSDLLFGGDSTGGLLSSLLGGGQSGGAGGILSGLGSLGKGIGSLFGGGSSNGGYDTAWAGAPSTWMGNDLYTGNGGDSSSWNQGNNDYSGDPGGGSWYEGFNGAGGQAAKQTSQLPTSSSSGPSFSGGDISSAANAIQGLLRGGTQGYLGAASNLGKLAGKYAGAPGLAGAAGALGSVMNIYNGFTSGTPQGVLGATASTAGLAGSSGAASALGASAATSAALKAAGTAALPLSLASIPFTIGQMATAKNDIGNETRKAYEQATGTRSVIVNAPTQPQASAGAQGGFAGLGSGYVPKAVEVTKSGQVLSDAQAQLALAQWAAQNGRSTGNFASADTALNAINTGGAGSQVYTPTATPVRKPTTPGKWGI